MYRLAPFCVLDAEHGAIGDRRMAAQRVLDIDGIDIEPAGYDHVLQPVLDEEETALVEVADVAGMQQAIDDRLGGLVRLLPVSSHQKDAASTHLPAPPAPQDAPP